MNKAFKTAILTKIKMFPLKKVNKTSLTFLFVSIILFNVIDRKIMIP